MSAMDKGWAECGAGRLRRLRLNSLQEFEGIVRNGKVELLSGSLPGGTRVQVRVKK